jgi:hypothetical protein
VLVGITIGGKKRIMEGAKKRKKEATHKESMSIRVRLKFVGLHSISLGEGVRAPFSF